LETLTVQEYADLKGVSHVTVYRWIEKNKVKYIVEHLEGKDVKKVLVDNDELLSTNRVSAYVSNENKYVSTRVESEDIIDVQPVRMPANDKYLELFSKMYEDNKNLAELAGQAKLLADSEHQTKQEYFKIVQENKQLLQEKTIVETENRLINKQLEELKQKLDNVEKKENNNWWSKL